MNQSVFKISIFVLFFFFSSKGIAQQDPLFALYNQSEGLFNPSSISDNYIQYEHNYIFGVGARRQWVNLASAPRTQFLKGEYITNTGNAFDLLLGGNIVNDKIGPISTTSALFRVASFMNNRGELGRLSAGIQFGVVQYRINSSSLQAKYPSDILTAENIQTVKPQVGVGVSYYDNFSQPGLFDNTNFVIGASATHIGFNSHEFKDEKTEFNVTANMHYYAYAKIKKELFGDQAVELNTWVRYVQNMPVNVDGHFIFYVNNIISLEFGANTSGTAHGGVGLNLFDFLAKDNLLHITYGFDPSFLKAGRAFGNTHEITIGYSFQ